MVERALIRSGLLKAFPRLALCFVFGMRRFGIAPCCEPSLLAHKLHAAAHQQRSVNGSLLCSVRTAVAQTAMDLVNTLLSSSPRPIEWSKQRQPPIFG